MGWMIADSHSWYHRFRPSFSGLLFSSFKLSVPNWDVFNFGPLCLCNMHLPMP
jgi:hypothetical protein